MSGLTMRHFLETVARAGTYARLELRHEGFPEKVILRKAEKAAQRGYTEYGVAADLPWLTEAGWAFIVRAPHDTEETP